MTAEGKSENDGQVEMVSELKSFIVSAMKIKSVPSVPPSKNMKSIIGSSESMKSDEIDDSEILAAGAADVAKMLERMTDMSINRASGKPVRSVKLE